MQLTTIEKAFVAIILASALSFAACGNDENPTSPTQSGPPVAQSSIISLTGQVAVLDRSGAGDMDISFRIDDFTIVRAKANTPVQFGGQIFRTDAVRPRQTVTVEGRRSNGFLDATRITIIAQAR